MRTAPTLATTIRAIAAHGPGALAAAGLWVAVMSADSPPAALPRVTLAEPAAHRIALNTVSGTTTMDLWPVTARPTATGRAVGISTTATPGNHTHPSLVFRPLVDAPPVPVVLAWREGPGHPAVPDLPALTHAAPASGTTGSRTAPPVE